jgi:hypothetical protein
MDRERMRERERERGTEGPLKGRYLYLRVK